MKMNCICHGELHPIEGGHQKTVKATVVRDTKTLWFVVEEGKMGEVKYSKDTLLRVGQGKDDFPRRRLELIPND